MSSDKSKWASSRIGGVPKKCASCSSPLTPDNTAQLCGRCLRDQRDQLRTPAPVGEGFWETDALRAAFQSQHIGRVLKAYRHHPHFLKLFGKALNQQTLGRWLGLTQAQVSKLENGKPENNLDTLRSYASILHIPQRMLWFDLPGQTRINVDPAASVNSPTLGAQYPTIHRVSALSTPAGAINDPILVVHRMSEARVHFEQMYRNSGGLAAGSRIDSFLAREAVPMLLGGGASHDELELRRQRAFGSLVALAGVCAYDSEEWSVAHSRFYQALAIAERTQDRRFHSYVLALMANQALALEDYVQAVNLADLGLRSSGKAPVSPLSIDLQTMKAKALASMGDTASAMSAIREIESAVANVSGNGEVGEASYAQEGHLQAQLAEALTNLGEIAAAHRYAEQSVLSEGHARGKVNRLASLATLEYAKGDLERASALACEMVEIARGMDSRRLASRFAKLRNALASRPATVSREAIARIDTAISFIP
ncbi:helix-turn-helix domain-containing protein [Actinokineospora sp. NPDC004072]